MRTVKENSTYKSVQDGTVTHYWDNNYAINATKVGSPTVTSKAVVSGFSTSDYYTNDFGIASVNSWELVFKVYGYSTSHNNPLCSKNASQSWLSKIVVTTSGAVQISLSNNNSSWNVCNFTTSNTIPNNTWGYVKTEFTGTAYIVSWSTDNETWTELGRATTSTKYTQNLNKICSSNDTGSSGLKAGYGGQVDFRGCYCKINGSVVWDGAYITSRTEVTSSDPYDYTTTENVYKCWGQAPTTVFESSTAGDYTISLGAGRYEITCVGGGGAAAMRGVYDDKGYGWGGGSGGAYKGIFNLAAGSYNVIVGAANNNTKAQSGNTQTLNPSDTTTHDSSISGVLTCGGGGAAHYNTSYVGAAGAAPVFYIMPESTTLNSAGRAGSYNSGGKGSAAAATCAGGASVYLDYGKGQGCKTSEYAAKRSWINGTNGYVRIRRIPQ